MPLAAAVVCQCGCEKTRHHGVLVCTKHCDKPCTRSNCPSCRKAATNR